MKLKITGIVISIVITTSSILAQQKQAQIIVGPNIQVSHDGNFNHSEMMMASNPTNPANLIIGCNTFPAVASTQIYENKVYTTTDYGKTWNDISLHKKLKFTVDPQTAFGIDGTAYYVEMFSPLNSDMNATLYFYKSTDDGISWDKPTDIQNKVMYDLPNYNDHPQLIVDQTFGKFSGRIYITFIAGDKKTNTLQAWLLRSENDGKSFIGPIKLVSEGIKNLYQVNPLMVSSKGVLFATYVASSVSQKQDIYIVSSKDGGVSFALPVKIGEKRLADDGVGYDLIEYGLMPQYAIDNQSERYKDRLYCIFNDLQYGKFKLLLTYSKDDGNTWTEPKIIDSNVPSTADQYQPSVTVNSKGVVGVRWYDTRGTEIGKGFNEYFTASLDGGDTFLPAVKVSSEISKIANSKNEIVVPIWKRSPDKNSIQVTFLPSRRDWAQGGHYMQFTSDATGVFHDFWADGREGKAYQIYTSAIKVIEPGDHVDEEKIDFERKYKKEERNLSLVPRNKVLSQITKNIFLSMDSVTYDTIANILSVPVRIKNISDKPVFGPFKLEINKIDTSYGKKIIPLIVNSDNKRKGIGAQFNYGLSNSNILRPGEETETIILKFNIKIPRKITRYTDEQMKQLKLDKNYSIEWFSDSIADLHINIIGYLAGKDSISGKVSALKISPEKPKPGDAIIINYHTAGTMLEKSKNISVLIHAYGKTNNDSHSLYYTNEINLIKKGDMWIGKFSVADTCAGVLLRFTNGEKFDDNGSKFYPIKFYNKEGEFVKGASAGLALVYSVYRNVFNIKPDPDVIFELFEEEFKLDPELKKNYTVQYYGTLKAIDENKAAEFFKEEASRYEKIASPSLKELTVLKTIYNNQEPLDKKRMEWLDSLILSNYPTSEEGEFLQYLKVINAQDAETKNDLVNKFREQFPNSRYLELLLPDASKVLFNTLLAAGKYEEAYTALKKNPKATSIDYNLLAWPMYEEGTNLTLAKEVALKGIGLINTEIEASSTPPYYSKSQFRNHYGNEIMDTYGAILLKMGKNIEALKYMTRAYKMSEGNDTSVNERYVEALLVNGKKGEAKEALEKFTSNGKSTDRMKEMLKQAYVK